MRWRGDGRCGPHGRAPMPDPSLLAALRDLAPPGAGCAQADPGQEQPAFAGEDLPGAVPARLREFRAGRAAARAALAEIGHPAMAIPHGQDRAPVWPAGIIGSITHSATECLAIVLPVNGRVRGIGIDLEPVAPLTRDLWPAVLDEVERQALAAIPECRQAEAAMARFVAKEAAYKAQYPLTLTLLGFHDLRLSFAAGGYRAELQRPVPPLAMSAVVQGRIRLAGGHILGLATL